MKNKTIALRRGFTLVELLVVIAIIGVLAGILIFTITRVRVVSQRSACASNMRQIGVAIQLYAAENHGKLPYNYGGSFGPKKINGAFTSGDRWLIARFLEPYIGDDVYVCPDPANIEHAQLPSALGIVYTKISSALTTSPGNPQHKLMADYDTPTKERLFYCAFSPLDGSELLRDWPHEGVINMLYLDGHVGPYKPTWPGK
jgi:prepilin-type N-terminal cleavage/methylation domain-containing protein/prepilin-type processing-associated H-X9-DG protein